MRKTRKKRVALTIDAGLMKIVDSLVDGVDVTSRSNSVEKLLRKALGRERVTTAFVFAGGEAGTLTPKPMREFEEKPVLAHLVAWLKGYDVERFILATQKNEAVRSYFGDGSSFGVKIEYIAEEEPLGTAGSLALAQSRIGGTFAALNSDVLCDFNFPSMVEFHRKQRALATMALIEHHEASRYGVAALEGERVIEFREKPGEGGAGS